MRAPLIIALTATLVGCSSHGTGIKNNDLGATGGIHPFQSTIPQLAVDRGTIRLGGATAEVLDVEGPHLLILT